MQNTKRKISKFIFSLSCLILCSQMLTAQSDYKIKGILEDTLGNALIYSTVLLLEKSDSTMIDYTRSAMDGSFEFKDVKAGQHLVKTTYIGFLPLTVDASSQGEDVDLGLMQMTEIAEELMEVVIKTAKAPMRMRGDTIEYDATTFKVPEGSTVEDLLRRLPGIVVEADGSINADGKDVDKVTVDGKSFFGSDPKAATKNLPAEGVSKVQVFDSKTEEEEITGTVGESENKTMNLELKEDFKSGGFGKVTGGIGTEDRAELKGNYNRFNSKAQFSLVGVANNTGRNGLSWDDYQDFLGSQSFRFDSGGDYGFGGRSNFIVFGGAGGGIEQSIQSIFFQGGDNSGFPENYNGGVNYNYDNKKTKLSSVYYYNQTGLVAESEADVDKFYNAFVQNELSSSLADDVSRGHRAEVKIEQKVDSLLTLKLDMNGAYIDDKDRYEALTILSRDSELTSGSSVRNETNTTGNLFNGRLLMRKKFMKKGRSMGANISLLNTSLDDVWEQKSILDLFNEDGLLKDQILQDQFNDELQDKQVFKANTLYVEPLSKKFFFQSFYNFRDRNESGVRNVNDRIADEIVRNDSLSRTYNNDIIYNRVGSSLRYTHEGITFSAGLAYQLFDLKGSFTSGDANSVLGTVDKQFNNFIPHLSLNFSRIRNLYMNVSYSRVANEPEIEDLQPVVNNLNPQYIRSGNSELTPEIANGISFYTSKNYPLSDIRISFNGSLSWIQNQFTTEESVDENLITSIRPINFGTGGRSYGSLSVSFPIKKNKFTVRTRMYGQVNNRKTLVNSFENNTSSLTLSPSVRLNITPSQDFSLYVDANYSRAKTSYDLNATQNQSTENTELGVELNSKLLAGFYFNSSFNVNMYRNERFNQEQNIPILNASVYRKFMPGDKAEIRLSVYDAFKKNIGFSQSAYGFAISQRSTDSLSRYFMLSLTYNIRGMKSDVRKDSWW